MVQACTTGRRSVFPAFSRVAHRVAAISDVFPSAAVLRLVCIHDCSTLPRGVAVLRDAAGSQEVGRSSRVAACELTVVDPEVGLSCFVAQLDGRVVSVGPIVRAPGCARIGVAAKRNGACFV